MGGARRGVRERAPSEAVAPSATAPRPAAGTAHRYPPPVALALFAGIRVRDLAAARAWYERLLGEPSFFPNAAEVVWMLADERAVYIQEDPRPGGGLATAVVDDLDALLAEIAARGLEPDERETYGNGVRKAIFRDDDGNEIGFAGLPGA